MNLCSSKDKEIELKDWSQNRSYLHHKQPTKTHINNKMTRNSQLSTNEPKRKDKQQTQKLSKQLEQEQNQRNGHHMEGFQWGRGVEEQGEKVQRIRSISGRHKIDGERSKMVQETEDSKNLYVQPMDMN